MVKSLAQLIAICLCLTGCTELSPAPNHWPEQAYPETVTVYVRAGCPYCAQTIDLLLARQILLLIRDVAKDPDAYQELLAIYGDQFPGQKAIVPVTIKGGNFLRGYNPSELEAFLNDSEAGSPEKIEFCE